VFLTVFLAISSLGFSLEHFLQGGQKYPSFGLPLNVISFAKLFDIPSWENNLHPKLVFW